MSDDVNKILDERKKTHGDFTDHARITRNLKHVMTAELGWGRLMAVQAEALDMIAHKIGRILAGDPNVKDHWDDIAGYATLVANRCPEPKATAQGRAGELHRTGVADLPVIQDGLTVEERQELNRMRQAAHDKIKRKQNDA